MDDLDVASIGESQFRNFCILIVHSTVYFDMSDGTHVGDERDRPTCANDDPPRPVTYSVPLAWGLGLHQSSKLSFLGVKCPSYGSSSVALKVPLIT